MLCKDGAASPDFNIASLAPMIKDALANGAEGLVAALDGLLGGMLGSPDLLEVGGLAWWGPTGRVDRGRAIAQCMPVPGAEPLTAGHPFAVSVITDPT